MITLGKWIAGKYFKNKIAEAAFPSFGQSREKEQWYPEKLKNFNDYQVNLHALSDLLKKT